jgi:hypothetical protein
LHGRFTRLARGRRTLWNKSSLALVVVPGTNGQAVVFAVRRGNNEVRKTMKQFPIYIAAIAAVAAIGAPASQAADTQSGIIVAQATSPADANHPGSQPAFARPEQSSAQTQQPAQPAAQAPQQGSQPTAQSQEQRRQSTAQSPQRRGQPATTGSGSPQR